MNKIEKIKDVLVSIFIIVMFGGFLSIAVTGNVWESKFKNKCTEEVVGYVSNEYVEDYLYAPYHGGEVQQRYKTHVTYSFDVDETRYNVYMQHPGYFTYPEAMVFRYNPDNPTEFIYDVSEWYGEDKPDWQLSTATIK